MPTREPPASQKAHELPAAPAALDLDAIRDRHSRVSFEKLIVDYDEREDGADQIIDELGLTVAFMSTPRHGGCDDAEFLAHAPADIAALLAECDRLRLIESAARAYRAAELAYNEQVEKKYAYSRERIALVDSKAALFEALDSSAGSEVTP